MRFNLINESFKKDYSNAVVEEITSDKELLAKLLKDNYDQLVRQGSKDLNLYADVFKKAVEEVFPDEPWWENIGLDITADILTTQDPKVTMDHILDSIIEGSAYITESNEGLYKGYTLKYDNKGIITILDKNFKVVRTDVASEEEAREWIDAVTESCSVKERVQEVNDDIVDDLIIILENDEDTYRQFIKPVINNLRKKKVKGIYDEELAIKAFLNVVNNALSSRQFQHLYKYNKSLVNIITREAIAEALLDSFTDEINYGLEDNDDVEESVKKSKKQIRESLIVTQEVDFNDLLDMCWGQAVDNLKEIEDAGLEDELMSFLEEMYNETSLTNINDLLAYDWEYVFESIGMPNEEEEDDEQEESLTEDTVQKSNGKWTNRGDDGKEYGEFDTKKEADAQRKAMFANKG